MDEGKRGIANAILCAVGNAYETARAGGKHGGWYRIYREHGERQLERSIRSFEALIREHQAYIANPFLKFPRGADPKRVRDMVENGWPEDIQRHTEFIEILRGILRERRK
jgi:hypothetical protein